MDKPTFGTWRPIPCQGHGTIVVGSVETGRIKVGTASLYPNDNLPESLTGDPVDEDHTLVNQWLPLISREAAQDLVLLLTKELDRG
jgi:hypothetical protein